MTDAAATQADLLSAATTATWRSCNCSIGLRPSTMTHIVSADWHQTMFNRLHGTEHGKFGGFRLGIPNESISSTSGACSTNHVIANRVSQPFARARRNLFGIVRRDS